MSNSAIVFFGTPGFAVPTLKRLHQEWGVAAVVTAPDAPVGRGRHLQPPPVKVAAEQLGIAPIFQPSRLNDPAFIAALASISADIFCVLAFRILPTSLLALPALAFNVHPSLLPKFRGAAPIAHTIIAGERETGVTTFVLSQRVDAGAILLQQRVPVPDGVTAGELSDLLAPLCAELASQTIAGWRAGALVPVPQDDSQATAAPKIHPETAIINWNADARSVRNFIHGYSPEPGAWTLLDNQRLKIYRVRILDEHFSSPVAGAWQMDRDRWEVCCACGRLELLEVQLPGRRRMSAADVLRGWRSARSGIFVVPSPTAVS
ncbi:MAG: methionyl-tRNA formyltransferase [Chlorobi bacterium]|nr:methionyl-tRNA formyltransferase [Chlorobiota bacterium]